MKDSRAICQDGLPESVLVIQHIIAFTYRSSGFT